ncbi:MAG: aldehyde ferredoxin oxidoreductase family protein [Pseudomonadota bacterium]
MVKKRNILKVDLTVGAWKQESPPEGWDRRFIGGSGLAAKYFWEYGDFNAQPLSPEALLIIMNGPLAGLKLSGASRCAIAGRSPLTGHWGDSSCGGYFAPELRYAGYDGLVLTGRAERPCLLVIEDERVQLLDAAEYWGRGVEFVNQALKERFGPGYRNLVIGPAGEAMVGYAAVLSENHHAFGRAGFGAVMGSKNLKAILVKAGQRRLDLADPDGFEELRRELGPKIRDALASQVLRENGTAANLEGGMYAGDVPIRNFTSNFNEEMAEKLTGSELTDRFLVKRHGCAYCSIACKRIIEIKDGPFSLPAGPGPEYETIVAFGSLLNSADLAAACKAGRVCNDLGLDTISAGGTIAWAMEAYEKGDLTPDDADGLELNWADLKTVVDEILPRIAYRRGRLGNLLAGGSVAAARVIGKGLEYTTHSKGLEAPMHDPRGGGHGLALSYAVSPRGACHVADPMLFMELGACYWPEIGFEYELEPYTDENKAEAAVTAAAMGALENSACLCQFADGELTIPDWLGLFNTVAGYGWDIPAMMAAGRRVFLIKRLINHRCGLAARDDALTPRLLEPARDGEPAGIEINFEGMIKRFYELMGLDEQEGIPGRSVLDAAGLAEEAELAWRT